MTQPRRTRQFLPARPRPGRAVVTGPELPVDPLVAPLADLLAAATTSVRVAGSLDVLPLVGTQAGFDATEGLYAALGAVALGQYATVRATLAVLFAFQRADGRLPGALAPRRGLRAWLAERLGQGDDTLAEAHYTSGLVPTALALWLGAAYVEVTGDRQFLQESRAGFERALAWLEAQRSDGLPACEGAPTLLEGVLVYRALRAMGEMAMPRGEAVEAARYWARAASLRERVNAHFWDAGRGHYVETAGPGNLLAAAFGLAARGQALATLDRADDGLGLEAGLLALALGALQARPQARERA